MGVWKNRMTDKIALTGATGFVGAALAKRLTEAGHRIQALIRPASIHKKPVDIAAEWIEGDLNDRQSLGQLVNGVDSVIHCAGAVRGATREQFNRVNADGVERLVQAAVEQRPMPRLLLISSLAAREPLLSHYAASKRQGERVLIGQSHQLPWTIYRPCAVYGPGDREILPVNCPGLYIDHAPYMVRAIGKYCRFLNGWQRASHRYSVPAPADFL
jgi:nucleoside-diphosphate-sugar epimerase